MKEWNLGDKVIWDKYGGNIKPEDFKEFIRRLKENKCPIDCQSCKDWIERIDKLAGESLR